MRNIVALAAACALCACAGQQGGGFAIAVQPAIAGEPNTIELRDSSLREQTVSVEVSMPEMEMPAKRVTLVQETPGRFVARGVTFSMSGSWSVRTVGSKPHDVVIAVR